MKYKKSNYLEWSISKAIKLVKEKNGIINTYQNNKNIRVHDILSKPISSNRHFV